MSTVPRLRDEVISEQVQGVTMNYHPRQYVGEYISTPEVSTGGGGKYSPRKEAL